MTKTTLANRLSRRATAGLMFLAALATPLAAPAVAAAADRPAPSPEAQKAAERAKWENRIVFWGEEQSDSWSLRIPDKLATERATVRYTSMWKYSPEEKQWIKVDDRVREAPIVLPAEKPQTAPEDSQIIAELPVGKDPAGVYYVHWTVNDTIDGATFCRLGPGLIGQDKKDAETNPPKAPPGFMNTIVPINKNRAVFMSIPDPRFNTGQPKKVATSRPSK